LLTCLANMAAIYDFTSYKCAYEQWDLAVYPTHLRTLVSNIRALSRAKIEIVQEVDKINFIGRWENRTVLVYKGNDWEIGAENHWMLAGVPYTMQWLGVAPSRIGEQWELVFEPIDSTPLSKYTPSSTHEVISIARQVFQFLAALTETAPNRPKALVYGNITAKTIFVKRDKSILIEGLPGEGPRSHASPEQFFGRPAGFAADVWAAGVVLQELDTERPFIRTSLEIPVLYDRIGPPPLGFLQRTGRGADYFDLETGAPKWKSKLRYSRFELRREDKETFFADSRIIQLLKRIFVWDPRKRITAKMALQYPVFELDTSSFWSAYDVRPIAEYPTHLRDLVGRMRGSLLLKEIRSLKQLGAGGVGTVDLIMATDSENKVVTRARKTSDLTEELEHEAEMLWRVEGVPYSITWHGFFNGGLLLEYVDSSNVDKVRIQNLDLMFLFMTQCFTYLIECKKRRIIHSDFKPENLLLDLKSNAICVIDYDMAQLMAKLRYPVIQTETYRAPEIFLNQKSQFCDEEEECRYSYPAELWSVGVTIFQVYTGKFFIPYQELPYGQNDMSGLLKRLGPPPQSYLQKCVATSKYFDKVGDLYEAKPSLKRPDLGDFKLLCPNPKIRELLSRILVWDPDQRIAVEEALRLIT
jgi:serine/threonine protein kinase